MTPPAQLHLYEPQAPIPFSPGTKVRIVANELGEGDWFTLEIDGRKLEEGHSINKWTLISALNALGITVEVLAVGNEHIF